MRLELYCHFVQLGVTEHVVVLCDTPASERAEPRVYLRLTTTDRDAYLPGERYVVGVAETPAGRLHQDDGA